MADSDKPVNNLANIPQEDLELIGKLWQATSDLTHGMVNSVLESNKLEIAELKKQLDIYDRYISYVQRCIVLYTVPRDFSFWYDHIQSG